MHNLVTRSLVYAIMLCNFCELCWAAFTFIRWPNPEYYTLTLGLELKVLVDDNADFSSFSWNQIWCLSCCLSCWCLSCCRLHQVSRVQEEIWLLPLRFSIGYSPCYYNILMQIFCSKNFTLFCILVQHVLFFTSTYIVTFRMWCFQFELRIIFFS